MQTKLYTIQFFLTTNQLHSQSLSSDCTTHGFAGAHEFCRFCQTHGEKEKSNSWRRPNSWKREDSNPRKREGKKNQEVSHPPANPTLQTEHEVCGMEYIHWPAWLYVLLCSPPTPAHLLIC